MDQRNLTPHSQKGTQNKVYTEEISQLKVVITFYLVQFYR